MVKYLAYIFFALLINAFESKSQNLVPNPSFEDYTTCPNDVGLIDSAVGWTVFGSCEPWGPGTPDYYNTCANPHQYPDSFVYIPLNWCGYQQPASGNAYAGLVCYAITVANCREIIGCHLIEPLEIGKTYSVSLKANCSFGGYEANYVASNGLGVKFTMNAYSNDNPVPIDNNPAIYSPLVITDTMNWTNIEGTFVADSAYEYLAIGNFIQDSNLDTIHLGSFIFRSYYYIDDVSVVPQYADAINNPSQIELDIVNNPVSDWLNIVYQSPEDALFELFDINGHRVAAMSLYHYFKNRLLNVSSLPAGVYLGTVTENGKRVWSEKVVVER